MEGAIRPWLPGKHDSRVLAGLSPRDALVLAIGSHRIDLAL